MTLSTPSSFSRAGSTLAMPGRVADRAGGHDRALAGHQPRHGGDRAQAAGVGQRDVGALVGAGVERVVPRARHQLVVAGGEVGEGQRAGVVQHRHHQRAGAVLALHVHGQAQRHPGRGHALRLAVGLGVGVAHHGQVLGGLDDRPGDQVGEGELAARVLQRAAAGVQRGHRDACGSWWPSGSSGSRS